MFQGSGCSVSDVGFMEFRDLGLDSGFLAPGCRVAVQHLGVMKVWDLRFRV